jgi:imidazolonepropionase-like amidohydrolase
VPIDQLAEPFAQVVTGPLEMRRAIREDVKMGADWIKLSASGGENTPTEGQSQFADDELREAVTETHRLHKKISVHAHGLEPIRSAVNAGVDCIEHATRADAATLTDIARRKIFIVPTLYDAEPPGTERDREPDAWLKRWQAFRAGKLPEQHGHAPQTLNANLKPAAKAGVRIVFGTDVLPEPKEGVRQFTLMVESGLSPWDAIRSATTTAAEMLGIADQVGRVAPGYQADLIAVDNNPLESIRAMEHIRFVMKAGRVIRNDLLEK